MYILDFIFIRKRTGKTISTSKVSAKAGLQMIRVIKHYFLHIAKKIDSAINGESHMPCTKPYAP
ncbi:MAG TPA: hypothetical protein DDY13_05580 [Cytophagales bacterium]|jgi:hypothetical protein|nr:hypothetical protein [Cytophagales bacterium]